MGGQVGPRTSLNAMAVRKIPSLPFLEISPHGLVTLLTELPWLLFLFHFRINSGIMNPSGIWYRFLGYMIGPLQSLYPHNIMQKNVNIHSLPAAGFESVIPLFKWFNIIHTFISISSKVKVR
jgi:hypothetical protein